MDKKNEAPDRKQKKLTENHPGIEADMGATSYLEIG